MRRAAIAFAVIAAVGTAGLSAVLARQAVIEVEERTLEQIRAEMAEEEDSWAQVSANGLRVELTGTAPTEAARFQLLRKISAVVPGKRVNDRTIVSADQEIAVPEFSLQILRNMGDISLIGLVPEGDLVDALPDRMAALDQDSRVTNMLEVVSYDPPAMWPESLAFGLSAATELNQARISVTTGRVEVAGVVATQERLDEIVATLQEDTPNGVEVTLDITAPRPVIAPYHFSAHKAQDALVIDRCAVPSAELTGELADRATLGTESGECDVGLGAPSPEWGGALMATLNALEGLEGGSVEIEDVDIRLTGPEGMNPGKFEEAMTDLAAALPSVFSLHSELPEAPATEEQAERIPPRFTAERTAEGNAIIRGDVQGDILRRSTESFATAQFGFESVDTETNPRDDLPQGWTVQVVGGLEALGMLSSGTLEVTESSVSIAGISGQEDTPEKVTAFLSDKIPSGISVTTDIAFDPDLVQEEGPVIGLPGDLCAEQIEILLSNAQILFPPGETEIDEQSLPIIDAIADILKRCPGTRFEIAGHTDSQGRESSNMALSQARADAVLSALTEREIRLVLLLSKGYGEDEPIAENDTEEGRALNRRIEFRLLEEPVEDTGLDPHSGDGSEMWPGPHGEAGAASTGNGELAMDQHGDEILPDDEPAPAESGPGEAGVDEVSEGTDPATAEEPDAETAPADEAPTDEATDDGTQPEAASEQPAGNEDESDPASDAENNNLDEPAAASDIVTPMPRVRRAGRIEGE